MTCTKSSRCAVSRPSSPRFCANPFVLARKPQWAGWCAAKISCTSRMPRTIRVIALVIQIAGRWWTHPPLAALAQGQRAAWRLYGLSAGSPAVLRQADWTVAELRGAGGYRDRKRASVDRDARRVGAADSDRRGVAGHQ